MFLANNVKFGSLNEVVTFIDNVVTEKREYSDRLILDRDITLQEAYYKVMTTCGFDYIPSEEDMWVVWEIMGRLKQEDWNRLYYKNNLYDFIDNTTMTRAVQYMLQKLDKPFLDPNKVPKEITIEMDEFLSILKEYVYYSYQIIDRLDRTENMIRSVVAIVDTDSSIVSLDAWYRFVLEKTYDTPMKIKTETLNPVNFVKADEFGDADLIKVVEFVDTPTDYSFYTDEVIELQKGLSPIEILPQESLRYSIINIMAYCLYQIVNDYMEQYTKNSNTYSSSRKCLLIMKNEFLFKRVLLTDAKKNYASIQELQEGHLLPADKPDIKGLPMAKSTLNTKTQERLQEILFEDVLNCEEIDQIQVLKELAKFEKDIYNSLLSKEKEFYKPLSIKSLVKYEDPMRIQGIKASVVWNHMRDGLPAIDLEQKNSIYVIKVNVTPKNIEKVKDIYPDVYTRLSELLNQKDFCTGITALAIPRDVETPDWVLEFIDYTTIINDNLKNFPLTSLGLYRMNDTNNYTNILKI